MASLQMKCIDFPQIFGHSKVYFSVLKSDGKRLDNLNAHVLLFLEVFFFVMGKNNVVDMRSINMI